MKDLILILAMCAVFWFCYFIMKKADAFFDENQRRIELEQRKNDSRGS